MPIWLIFVYSKTDMQEIERWEWNMSTPVAMMELIARLPTHIEDWFQEFVIALKTYNYTEALKALEPKLVSAGESCYSAV